MAQPMVFANKNKMLVIHDIRGGRGAKKKLVDRGFCIGSHLCVLKDDNSNVVVKVNDSKFVLGFGLASKIIVKEV
jgi:ferrous iron transport protein A